MTNDTAVRPAESAAPSGRRSKYLIDLALDMRRKGMLGFWMDMWQTYGDLACLQAGPGTVFLVVHPDHVRHVSITNRQNYDKLHSYDGVRELLLGDGLVASTGELWKRQRKLMAPFFTPRGIENYYSIIASDGQAFVQRWEDHAARGLPVEMIDEMMFITASIILRSMFSSEVEAQMTPIKEAVETMIQFTAGQGVLPVRLPLWAPLPANVRYNKARRLVHDYIEGLIARRRALPEADWPDDLLSKLMRARDEATGEAMSDSLLRDESITLFFAGHETTARTLTFLFYALSQNPNVEARLHEEIDTVLGNGTPTVEDLKALPYTMQCIKETLRLYPPAPMYVRDAVGDDEIDGQKVPAGASMILFPYATHRHPDFWEDPLRFDPDRWLPEREAARHPYAYHPFATGARQCIGNHFSLFESHILTAMLARRFAPRMLPGHRPRIVMAGTLGSANGMPMFIRRR